MRIPDRTLLADLEAHFARSGFAVRAVEDAELAVERGDAPDEDQSRREVAAHLMVWELLHPLAPAEIVD